MRRLKDGVWNRKSASLWWLSTHADEVKEDMTMRTQRRTTTRGTTSIRRGRSQLMRGSTDARDPQKHGGEMHTCSEAKMRMEQVTASSALVVKVGGVGLLWALGIAQGRREWQGPLGKTKLPFLVQNIHGGPGDRYVTKDPTLFWKL